MGTCNTCNGKLVCATCGPTRTVGATAQECRAMKGAIWVHIKDDSGKGVEGVPVDRSGTAVKSDPTGLAGFDGLKGAEYTVTVDLSKEPFTRTYEPPSVTTKTISLPEGEVRYWSIPLKRLSSLEVRLDVEGDPKKKLAGATVKVTGGEPPPDATTKDEGIADLGTLKAGTYEVTVTLGDEDKKTHVAPKDPIEVTLEPGKDKVLSVPVIRKNIISPALELEYKVALLDRKLSTHQEGTEEKLFADATRVAISLVQTNARRPYAKALKLKCAPANVEVYFDEACKTKLAGDLAAGAALPEDKAKVVTGGKPLDVYLRGITAGKFDVSVVLEDPADECVALDTDKLDESPAVEKMGVVELQLVVHEQDTPEIVKLEVDPDADPPALTGNDTYDPFATAPKVVKSDKYHEAQLKKYHDALEALQLPAQKALTDEQKVKAGRLVHAQRQEDREDAHGRAKLVVKKVNPDHWPAGTESYELYVNRTNASGAVELFDAEWGDTARKPHAPLDGSKLTAGQVLWIEGKTATRKLRDVRLDVTLDRPEGGARKEAKRNADWARFTVVKIDEVKVDYTAEKDKDVAWLPDKERFYINLKAPDADARKVTIGAKLSEKLADVTVHFMLAPDENNAKTTNWGIDLPKGGSAGPVKSGNLTIAGGPDSAKFRLTGPGKMKLEFNDGVIDTNVQDEYEVVVARSYDDGSLCKKTYTHYPADGADTSGWPNVKTYTDGDFPAFKEEPWRWNKLDVALKHRDKATTDRKKLLHLSAKTDAEGYAKVELVLSRFGGDKFWPTAYVDQDPHLAKYVRGHAELKKRVPVLSKKSITVCRKIWYQRVTVEGIACPEFTQAAEQYKRVKAKLTKAPDLVVSRATVDGYNPKAIYPAYMVKVGGGNAEKLVVSDTNKNQFFASFVAAADKPNMIPILVCDAQWDPAGTTAPATPTAVRPTAFPLAVGVGKKVLSPPLQGGDLFVSGTWKAAEYDTGTATWSNVRSGSLSNADISVDPSRTDLRHVRVALPAGVGATTAETWVYIEDLVVKGANSYLGESFNRRILAVYDPSEAADFQNTISHELGHAYKQVPTAAPEAGVPAHGVQFNAANQGNHCRYLVDKCVMYDSGPIAGSQNRYCDKCHPYLLVQDMTAIV